MSYENPTLRPNRRGPVWPTPNHLFLEHDTMIISLAYAMRLIKSGKATIVATVTHDGVDYYVVNRHDLQRTDHAMVPA
jgi:hypothetical protein